MEIFVKIGFAKFLLLPKKSEFGRGREGWQPPIPPALMGAISPVSSIKHIKVLDKFHIKAWMLLCHRPTGDCMCGTKS